MIRIRQYADAFKVLSHILQENHRFWKSQMEKEGVHTNGVRCSFEGCIQILDSMRKNQSISDWVDTARTQRGMLHLMDVLNQQLLFNSCQSRNTVSCSVKELQTFRLMPTSRETTITELVEEWNNGWQDGMPLSRLINEFALKSTDGGRVEYLDCINSAAVLEFNVRTVVVTAALEFAKRLGETGEENSLLYFDIVRRAMDLHSFQDIAAYIADGHKI